ncbi:MAG: sulfurtransferase TusA family protein, partial [Synechococcus sp.]
MGSSRSLDLRGTPCPVNFIRCKLALESLQAGEQLQV